MTCAPSEDSDAQADLSLRWAHMSCRWFCHAVAQIAVQPLQLEDELETDHGNIRNMTLMHEQQDQGLMCNLLSGMTEETTMYIKSPKTRDLFEQCTAETKKLCDGNVKLYE